MYIIVSTAVVFMIAPIALYVVNEGQSSVDVILLRIFGI